MIECLKLIAFVIFVSTAITAVLAGIIIAAGSTIFAVE